MSFYSEVHCKEVINTEHLNARAHEAKRNVEKISTPKRSIKITDHFNCTSANAIYCITCTLCIGKKRRRLGDRFREQTQRNTPKTTRQRPNRSRDTLIYPIYVQYNRKATSNNPFMDNTVTSGIKALKYF